MPLVRFTAAVPRLVPVALSTAPLLTLKLPPTIVVALLLFVTLSVPALIAAFKPLAVICALIVFEPEPV